MFMRRKLPVGILLALVLTLSLTASAGAQTVADVEAKFGTWDWADAVAAGYATSAECVAVPGVGTMGYHFVKFDLLGPEFDVLNPAIVLVDHTSEQVVAVEYVAVDVGQPRPSVLGVEMEGPDTHPGMPPIYSRHMWLVDNPDGQFAAFNPSPALSCPGPPTENLLKQSVEEIDDEDVFTDHAARFRDENALSDSLVMDFTDVPALPSWLSYEAWLIDGTGDKVSVGILALDNEGTVDQTYVSESGANLIATYDRFAISLEPVPDPDPATPGPIYYSDSIPAGAFTHIGHLVVSLPSNPDGKGIATGLREQMEEARLHATLAQKSTTLGGKQTHAHHVINIIEGTSGDNYDADFAGPGDGFGVLNYAADAIKHAGLAKNAAPDNETVVARADEVIEAANRTIDFATRTREAALRVIATTNDFIARIETENMVSLTDRGLNGTDEDGDGDVGATGEEGGANTVYTKSQDMGQFEPEAGAAAPSVGDPLVPVLALAALMAGLVLTTGGGLMLFRRRRTA